MYDLSEIINILVLLLLLGLPWWLNSKESACQCRSVGLIPGSGRSPREGNGNTLQYSCLGNLMDREAWQAIGVAELDTAQRLNKLCSCNCISLLVVVKLFFTTILCFHY